MPASLSMIPGFSAAIIGVNVGLIISGSPPPPITVGGPPLSPLSLAGPL